MKKCQKYACLAHEVILLFRIYGQFAEAGKRRSKVVQLLEKSVINVM
jgi:hypothetical protein